MIILFVIIMLTEAEQEVLQMISKRHLVRKSEIISFFDGTDAVAAARGLVEKGLLQVVIPIGEKCFAITQKGMRFSEGKI